MWTIPATVPAWPAPAPAGVLVQDGAVPDAQALRREALASTFRSVGSGHETFHGLAPASLAPLVSAIRRMVPNFQPNASFFRQSPVGQREPYFVHSDRGMGTWTAILYLTPDPPEEDGTVFWVRRDAGAIELAAEGDTAADIARWADPTLWEARYRVPAAFNRLLVFRSPLYHSRAILENYGSGDDARLIQVCFGEGQ